MVSFKRIASVTLCSISLTLASPNGLNEIKAVYDDEGLMGMNCGFINREGQMVLPIKKEHISCHASPEGRPHWKIWGKYGMYVNHKDRKAWMIDATGNIIHEVFRMGPHPDSPSDGLVRIIKRLDGQIKIGFIDATTSQIIIEPIYDCAYPFYNGKAKVGFDCVSVQEGEYRSWKAEKWLIIDLKGNEIMNDWP